MGWMIDVTRMAWQRSSGPLRRGDPRTTGAATAYYGLFALVPLTIAFTAVLTFVDRSGTVLEGLVDTIDATLPDVLAGFLNELIEESYEWVAEAPGIVLIISIVIAQWSGSRAVYTIQKALRDAEGVDDERAYLHSRGLGVAVTVAAGLSVTLTFLVVLAGDRFWEGIASDLGLGGGGIPRSLGIAAIIVLAWLVLWSLYRWGPPEPIPHPSIIAAAVGALLVLGTVVAFRFIPEFSSLSASLVAAIGIVLLWFYYMGVVVVAGPILIVAFIESARSLNAP